MANSKDRRTLRRLLQEPELRKLLVPPSPSPPAKRKQSFWKRIPSWLYTTIGVVSLAITLLGGWPWLWVEEGSFLDSSDPYSELFRVANGGYIPVTNVSAECVFSFNEKSTGTKVFDNILRTGEFADYLAHDGSATLPCFYSAIDVSPDPGATLDIVVGYAFYHLNKPFLRRTQKFHFRSVGRGSTQHWMYVS